MTARNRARRFALAVAAVAVALLVTGAAVVQEGTETRSVRATTAGDRSAAGYAEQPASNGVAEATTSTASTLPGATTTTKAVAAHPAATSQISTPEPMTGSTSPTTAAGVELQTTTTTQPYPRGWVQIAGLVHRPGDNASVESGYFDMDTGTGRLVLTSFEHDDPNTYLVWQILEDGSTDIGVGGSCRGLDECKKGLIWRFDVAVSANGRYRTDYFVLRVSSPNSSWRFDIEELR